MRSASSVTVDRPAAVVLIISRSMNRLGVRPSSRATRSLARRNLRNAARSSAASRKSGIEGSMQGSFLFQAVLNRLNCGFAWMRLPERHNVVRRPEHVREADVLAPEALIGPDDPLCFLAILGKEA